MLTPSSGYPDSPLAKVEVRKAVEYAINKEAIVNALGFGYLIPLYQYCGSNQPVYDFNFQGRVYDPDKARQLLVEAGYPDGFHITLTCPTIFSGEYLAAIQHDLKVVGIDCSVEQITTAKWYEYEFSPPAGGWPDGLLSSVHNTSYQTGTFFAFAGINGIMGTVTRAGTTWYRPTEFFDLVDEFPTIFDADQQMVKAKEIIKMVYDQALIIPLYETPAIHIIQNSVQDYDWDKVSIAGYCDWVGIWLKK